MKIIIDTDLGCDCDDAGALVLAYALEHSGLCDILAITQCTSRLNAAKAIEAFNEYYGRSLIPVGTYKPNGFLDDSNRTWYDGAVAEQFMRKPRQKEDYEDPVDLIRRMIAETSGDPITIIGIGALNNIAGLLCSQPDAYSPLNGIELVAQNNCRLICMAGAFCEESQKEFGDAGEWNVVQDIAAAQCTVSRWPGEIIFCPYEVGQHVLTGSFLEEGDGSSPLYYCYKDFGSFLRYSWDQCTVHFAVMGENDIWDVSDEGEVTVDQKGITHFCLKADGKHRYVTLKNKDLAQQEIERLMQYKVGKNRVAVRS